MADLFRCEKLSKSFGPQQVLKNVSFCVKRAEILGIIGPNGAGKTTLMECLTGLLSPDFGSCHWQGLVLSGKQTKDHLFYMPNDVQPFKQLSVAAVLQFFQVCFATTPSHFSEIFQHLEISSVLDKKVSTLSKGFQKRLALAVALMSPQKLLLLDEPFDGFDLRQTIGVMQLLRQSLNDRSLLLCIHQLSEAEKICDRFLLLDAGQVVAQGTLEQLREQCGLPAGSLEEVFLACI